VIRKTLPALLLAGIALAFLLNAHDQLPAQPFHVVEATIPEMRAMLESGKLTSHELVTLYLARIGMYEDKLHCVITVNPNVYQEADERDRERAQGRVRGPIARNPDCVEGQRSDA